MSATDSAIATAPVPGTSGNENVKKKGKSASLERVCANAEAVIVFKDAASAGGEAPKLNAAKVPIAVVATGKNLPELSKFIYLM
ncbi:MULTISPECIES: hypothetical protein [unclassified Moorena]|uniref:hypothetical protein n=1 Tax=unclassified Moorena TaxID=2683338 RepID=UPI0025EDCFA2|nr:MULTISPECIES: hypothetical protein [unclassified Moorena]